MERPEQLTVIVKSEPQQPLEDGGRASWLVSVQTLLSGVPAELETTTASCSLASAASCSWLRVLGLAVSSRSPDTREPGLVHSGGFAGKQLVKIFSELLFFIFFGIC